MEIDSYARRTYELNFGMVDHDDVRTLDLVEPRLQADLLAAGFPCQPFSIAGVSKKNSLGRAHGFDDEHSGNLFFEICKVVDATRPRVIFLENVKNLLTHDGHRTWQRIRRELRDRGYSVAVDVVDSSPWVPQRRKRTFIIALDGECFPGQQFTFPPLPEAEGPVLGSILDESVDAKYTLTPNLWQYLQDYSIEHRRRGNGFGYGLVGPDSVTRTLSARYYKDGSEILVRQANHRPRRLTPVEAARLMGFPNPVLDRDETRPPEAPPLTTFRIPVSDWRAYRQLGNSIVSDVVDHLATALVSQVRFAGVPR